MGTYANGEDVTFRKADGSRTVTGRYAGRNLATGELLVSVDSRLVFITPEDIERAKEPERMVLPLIDLRMLTHRSPIVVALTVMVPGSERDMRTGDGDGDYVHVTRTVAGFDVVHVASQTRHESDDVARVSRFIKRHLMTARFVKRWGRHAAR